MSNLIPVNWALFCSSVELISLLTLFLLLSFTCAFFLFLSLNFTFIHVQNLSPESCIELQQATFGNICMQVALCFMLWIFWFWCSQDPWEECWMWYGGLCQEVGMCKNYPLSAENVTWDKNIINITIPLLFVFVLFIIYLPPTLFGQDDRGISGDKKYDVAMLAVF